jgi:hypothetical protein
LQAALLQLKDADQMSVEKKSFQAEAQNLHIQHL